jgi:hypothetical protein
MNGPQPALERRDDENALQTNGNERLAMTPALRKANLTADITFSVGWIGAVAAFLALGIAGLTSKDAEVVRSAYLAMKVTAWFVIVPLAFASLLTGIVQSLGTKWGLLRHYWVLTKFFLTSFATIVLLLKMKLIDHVAGVSAMTALSSSDFRSPRTELLATPVAACWCCSGSQHYRYSNRGD